MESKLSFNDAAADFMKATEKSTVAVIIPLYGYWADIPDNQVTGEVLSAVLNRIYSNAHHLYLIFVANPQTMDVNPSDPASVANILIAKSQAGNTKNIPVSRQATYPEYIREGIRCALNDTNARFVMTFDPWVLIQEGGVDALVERANRADDANVISGSNMRAEIQPEEFDRYQSSTPTEKWDINFDFLCMPRFTAEMLQFDPAYQTKPFFQMDVFQLTRNLGFASIASERIPIFPFDFPWSDYESREMFESDRAYFISKWGFDCGLIYEESTK